MKLDKAVILTEYELEDIIRSANTKDVNKIVNYLLKEIFEDNQVDSFVVYLGIKPLLKEYDKNKKMLSELVKRFM